MIYMEHPLIWMTGDENGNPLLEPMPKIKDVPKCSCHGINKRWYTDRSKPRGGSFRCPVKRAESQRAYNQRRYRTNQIYRTLDVVRKKRVRRDTAIVQGEQA